MSPAHPENWPVLAAKGAADPQLLKDVKALAAAAEESDGNPPLSEQTLVTLRASDADAGAHTVLTLALYCPDEKSDPATAQDLAGVAVVIEEPDGTGVLEIAVHPSYRNQGVADRLVGELKNTRGFDGPQGLVPRQPRGRGRARRALRLRPRSASCGRCGSTSAAAELPDVRRCRTARRSRAFYPAGTRTPGSPRTGRLRAPRGAGQHDPRRPGRQDGRGRGSIPPASCWPSTPRTDILGFHWTKVHPAARRPPGDRRGVRGGRDPRGAGHRAWARH